VDGTKTKVIIVSLVAIVIIVASIGFYLIKTGPSYISAMERKTLADEIANNWNSSAFLIIVSSGGDSDENGRYSNWQYCYATSHDRANQTNEYSITIYSNGTTSIFEFDNPFGSDGINNWTIDSDEAYQIAIANESVQNMIHTNFTAGPGMQLYQNDNRTFWGISWHDPREVTFFVIFRVDATTGELLLYYK